MLIQSAIIIADRHTLFVEGLTRIIHARFPQTKVIAAQNIQELVDRIGQYLPSTIFLNMVFIEQHFSQIRPLLAENGYPEIVAVSYESCDNAKKRAASIGAQCIIDQQSTSELIWELVGHHHSAATSYLQSSSTTQTTNTSKKSSLTSRQQRILTLLAQGMTNREISVTIGCAENTVKVHLNSAYKILGVKNRTQAMCAMTKMERLSHTA